MLMTSTALEREAPYVADDQENYERVLAKIAQLRPLLVSQAPLHEKNGELSREVTQALDEIGAFRLLLPRRLGGLCMPAAMMADLAVEISRACPTAGWLVTVMNSAAWVASKAPEPMQKALFAKGPAKICASTNGAGTLKPAGDGYVVDGRWAYASGSHQSDWACCPAVGEDGTVYDVALPMSALRIENTWQVAGMQGTGSDTIVAEGVAVRRDWFCTMEELWGGGGGGQADELSDRWSLWPLMRAKLLSVLIGSAEALLETVVAGKAKPIMYTNYAQRQDSPVFQARIGEISAKIRTARILMNHSLERVDEAARQGVVLSYEERAELRGLVAVCVDTLTAQVERLMSLSGSSVYASANTAQRLWRDFSVGARHAVFHSDSHYEVYGLQLLGVDPNIVPLEMV
jgi:alkylation response protein AidB-like acyl-CoA dehydrogenase